MTILRIKPESIEVMFDILFTFFSDNLLVEHYELNFNAAEFFILLIEDENTILLKNNHLLNTIRNNLKKYLKHLKKTPRSINAFHEANK